MLYAIGAGRQVVAVSSYDDFPAEVKSLPRVGALLDPDVERILALRPDLVLTYGSQTSLETQLASAGIRAFSYRHAGVAGVLQTLRDLGAATGHAAEGERKAKEIEAQLEAIRARVRGARRPRTLLVFGRQPQSLQQLYVSGGTGFLHDILVSCGSRCSRPTKRC
jgi:iron complex transport system substrate-binding protein